MTPAQRIELRPSRVLAVVCTVAHIAAIALLTFAGIEMWLWFIMAAAIAVSCIATVRTALLIPPRSTSAIEITGDDIFSVQTRSAQWLECEVLDSTYVASFLTVINLREKSAGKRRHVVLCPDGVDPEDFRKLRVWLRWHRDAPAS